MESDVAKIQAELAKPFSKDEVELKPQAVSKDKSRAMAVPYVDARVVMNRLDDVLGIAAWKDEIDFLPDGTAVCRLSLLLGGEWVTKVDVGGASDQPDEGDRHKAAASNALKRAAVKFGVGRYLYDLPKNWLPYDAQKRCFRTQAQGQDEDGEGQAPRQETRQTQGKPTQQAKAPANGQGQAAPRPSRLRPELFSALKAKAQAKGVSLLTIAQAYGKGEPEYLSEQDYKKAMKRLDATTEKGREREAGEDAA